MKQIFMKQRAKRPVTKRWWALLCALTLTVMAHGQTALSGTVIDQQGTTWQNAAWTLSFTPTAACPGIPNGSSGVFSGQLSSEGVYNVVVPQLCGTPASFTMIIAPFTTIATNGGLARTFGNYVSPLFTVSGSAETQNFTPPPPMFPYQLNTYGYTTTELTANPTLAGSQFYIPFPAPGYFLTWTGSEWINLNVGAGGAPIIISPLSYGAVCDATWDNATSTYTGTDDRSAFKRMLAAMVVSGDRVVQLPQGQNCRVDPPGGIITSFAIANNVVTVQMNNSLASGEIVTPQGLSVGTYLNGAPLQVLATGLSSTQFEAQFYWTNVGSTADSGYGVSPALEFGQAPYNGFVWWGSQGSNGNNGGGATGATPMSASISAGPHGATDSTGPFFQFGYDKSANITGWTLDGSGNLTINFLAMPGGTLFTPGYSIVVSNTGGVDATYHTIATRTATQITITGVAGSAASGAQGLLHQPWTVTSFDGVQGTEWDNITIQDSSRVNPSFCAQGWYYCGYIPGSYGILDYRGGNMILNNVAMVGLQYGFFGVQSDFDHFNNMIFRNGYMGVYAGPASTPFYADRYNDFGDDVSFWVDGLNFQGVNITNSHFRSGSATTAQIIVANKEYDSTGIGGGGLNTEGVFLVGDDFEFGGGCPGTSTPLSFVSVDYAPGAASFTKDVHIITPTFVNSGGPLCNVPDFVRMGRGSGGPGYIDIVAVGATNGTFTNLINYTGTGTLQGAVLSPDLGSDITTNVATASGGGNVSIYTYQHYAPLANPIFTGTVTLPSGSSTALVLPYTANVNQILAYYGCMASGNANCLYMETGGTSPYTTQMYAASALFGTIYASFGSSGVQVNNANGGFIETNGMAGNPSSTNPGQEWYNITTNRLRFYDGTAFQNFAWLSDLSVTSTSTPAVNTAACIKAVGPPVVIGYCSTGLFTGSGATCTGTCE